MSLYKFVAKQISKRYIVFYIYIKIVLPSLTVALTYSADELASVLISPAGILSFPACVLASLARAMTSSAVVS